MSNPPADVATASDVQHAQPIELTDRPCGCGESSVAVPEIDARALPHAIRHAAVIGAFEAVPPGRSLVLVAPHDPLPLLGQLRQRVGGELDVAYLDRGPEAWRLRLTRAVPGTTAPGHD